MENSKSETPNLDELKRQAGYLLALLADPRPGLFTWREQLNQTIKAIASFGG